MTDPQSRNAGCLNNRIVGYHGVSERLSIQRQSGEYWIIVQTGFPIAPAK